MVESVHQFDPTKSVTLLQAALIARVHVTNLYKLRAKLGAFQHEGTWRIPLDALNRYIQERAARARDILTAVSPILDNQQPQGSFAGASFQTPASGAQCLPENQAATPDHETNQAH